MSVTRKDLPKKLYVYVEEDGQEKYLIANKTPGECATLSESRLVGVYDLKEVGKVFWKGFGENRTSGRVVKVLSYNNVNK
jgi:hypothetical protein